MRRDDTMKICITSQGETLESQVDPRFGRCAYFIIVDPETLDFEVVSNEAAGMSGGAGIQSAQLVSEKGVEAVITGNCGPNAFRTLNAAGIKVYTGAGGVVKDAVERYKGGELDSSGGPSVGAHFGVTGGE
jgi:predicted Fe-Mo cluster-binding NifX family protein